jgi:hypothetical protein
MGGATGGIMNGIMPGAEAVAPSGTTSLAPSAGTQLGNSVVDYSGGMPAPATFDAANQVSSAANPNMWGSETGAVTGPASGGSFIPGAESAPIYPQGSGLPSPGTNSSLGSNPVSKWWSTLSDKQKLMTGGAGVLGIGMLADRNRYGVPAQTPYTGALSRFNYNPDTYKPSFYAEGGITSLNAGGNMTVGGNPMDPTDTIARTNWQDSSFPAQSMAGGGIASLGSYSDGGHMLKGPGDGMSDSIPATIANKRPARLATDEFVVPADVVSHLGNGSSDAGAQQLYAMMNRVRKARTGNPKQGREINAGKYMPA